MIKLLDVEEFLELLFITDALSNNPIIKFKLSKSFSKRNAISIMRIYSNGPNGEYINFIVEEDFSCTVQSYQFDFENMAKIFKKYEKQHIGYKKVTKQRMLYYDYQFNFREIEDLKKFILDNIWENLK